MMYADRMGVDLPIPAGTCVHLDVMATHRGEPLAYWLAGCKGPWQPPMIPQAQEAAGAKESALVFQVTRQHDSEVLH